VFAAWVKTDEALIKLIISIAKMKAVVFFVIAILFTPVFVAWAIVLVGYLQIVQPNIQRVCRWFGI
jgi:hypothetical protein